MQFEAVRPGRSTLAEDHDQVQFGWVDEVVGGMALGEDMSMAPPNSLLNYHSHGEGGLRCGSEVGKEHQVREKERQGMQEEEGYSHLLI